MASPPQRPTRFQIFGERCSGTNYVSELLRRNLRRMRPTDEFGWKHGWPARDLTGAGDCLFVVVHRDPFDWVRSLHAKPWHAAATLRGRPIGEFLREPWWCVWGADMALDAGDPRRGQEMLHERDPGTRDRFANVMRLRSAKLRAWLALRDSVPHLHLLAYEDAAREGFDVVREIAARFDLRRWPWYRPIQTDKGGPNRFVPREHAPLSSADLHWIAGELDADLEASLGRDLSARVRELEAVAALRG